MQVSQAELIWEQAAIRVHHLVDLLEKVNKKNILFTNRTV